MKKIVIVILSLVLLTAISIGATLAFLSDTDGDVNVMTVGNVDVEQLEYERVVDENGAYVKGILGEDFVEDYGITESYKLQPFTQEKPAIPAVYNHEAGKVVWDEFQQLWNQVGAPGSNDLFGTSVGNVIDKFVFVKNTGIFSAYYRTLVAIECPEGISSDDIHVNFNGNNRFDYNDEKDGVQSVEDPHTYYVTVDDVRYIVFTATYTEKLRSGETSRPSLLQFYLDPSVTNEKCELFGETWNVLVATQAVQSDGFSSGAVSALDRVFGDLGEENHPWFDKTGPVRIFQYTDSYEVWKLLDSGRSIYGDEGIDFFRFLEPELDGKGATITMNGTGKIGDDVFPYGYFSFQHEEARISNLKVNGSGFIEYGHYKTHEKGSGTITNLVVEDFTSTLTSPNGHRRISTAFCGYGTLVLNDCKMTGAKTVDPNATAYDAAFPNKTRITINGGEYGSIYLWHQSRVTLNGAKVDKIVSSAITTGNYGRLTVGAGTVVGTIDLDSDSYKPAITVKAGAKIGTINVLTTHQSPEIVIEDGAEIDAIVWKGVTYTLAEWLSK